MLNAMSTIAKWQTAVLFLGVVELMFFLAVFVSPDTLSQHRMVSTNLFAALYFRVLLSLFVILQQLVCLSFLLRFRHRDLVETLVFSVFILVAFLGWVITISFDPDADRLNHAIGAGLFVAGTAIYYMGILRLTYQNDPVSEQFYDLAAGVVFISAGVFAFLYILLYFVLPGSAWIWENLAFITMVLGYLVFFWDHPFDPFTSLPPRTKTAIELSEIPIQCLPLIVRF